jgi:hypothetical protein
LKFFPPSLIGTQIFLFSSLCIGTHKDRSDISLPLDRAAPKYFPFFLPHHRVSLLPTPPPPLSAASAAAPSLYCRCHCPLSLLPVPPPPLSSAGAAASLCIADAYLSAHRRCRHHPLSLHCQRHNILLAPSPLSIGATHLSTYRRHLIWPSVLPPFLCCRCRPSLYRP